MHPKLLQEGERLGVLGSCCYEQLSEAHFLQSPLSFESQRSSPPGDPAEVSAQRTCCPRSPAAFTQTGSRRGACSPPKTLGIHPSHSGQQNPLPPGRGRFSFVHYQSLSCLRLAIGPQNDSTLDPCYSESEEFIHFTTIQ